MQGATETPLETMRACQQALREAAAVAANGSQSAASDVAVAIELLRTAAQGAGLNVDTNIGELKDTEYVERVRAERHQREQASLADADRARAILSG